MSVLCSWLTWECPSPIILYRDLRHANKSRVTGLQDIWGNGIYKVWCGTPGSSSLAPSSWLHLVKNIKNNDAVTQIFRHETVLLLCVFIQETVLPSIKSSPLIQKMFLKAFNILVSQWGCELSIKRVIFKTLRMTLPRPSTLLRLNDVWAGWRERNWQELFCYHLGEIGCQRPPDICMSFWRQSRVGVGLGAESGMIVKLLSHLPIKLKIKLKRWEWRCTPNSPINFSKLNFISISSIKCISSAY